MLADTEVFDVKFALDYLFQLSQANAHQLNLNRDLTDQLSSRLAQSCQSHDSKDYLINEMKNT